MILKTFLTSIILLGVYSLDENPCVHISPWKSLLNHQITKADKR